MRRLNSPLELATLLAANVPKDWRGYSFSATEWLSDPRNIALSTGGDLAMFAWVAPHEYAGHIWFASRGRIALERAKQMLDAMFSDYGAKIIRGETPKPEVAYFVRKLGFVFTGEKDSPLGKVRTCELVASADPISKGVQGILNAPAEPPPAE